MFCAHCGAKTVDGLVFCESCGQRQEAPAATMPAQAAPAYMSPPAHTAPLHAPPTAATKSGKGLVILMVVLIAAAGAGYLGRDRLRGMVMGVRAALPGQGNKATPADTGVVDALPRANDPANPAAQVVVVLEEDAEKLVRNDLVYAPGSDTPFTGTLSIRYPSGNKRGEVTVVNGSPDGPMTGWYENGQQKEAGVVRKNKREGRWTMWHENGQKSEEGTFRDDKQEGVWTIWDKAGNRSTVTYRDGQVVADPGDAVV